MSTGLVTRLHNYTSYAPRIIAIGLPIIGFSSSAFAQAVAGGIDPATGLANLAPWALGLSVAGISLTTFYKGAHATMEGRSIGPHIAALIGGLALAVGGYAAITHYGYTSGSAA